LCVLPQITLAQNQTVTEGELTNITVHLSGASPVYPLTIGYTVSGSSDDSDHDLVDGELVITQGQQGEILVNIANDSQVEGDETLIVTLADIGNVGANKAHVVTISEANIAPNVTLIANQANQSRIQITREDGEVVIRSKVVDVNTNDTVSYLWSASSESVTNTSINEQIFSFDPSSVSDGVYAVTLQVTDNGIPAKSDTQTLHLNVSASLTPLTNADSDNDGIPDVTEGYGDSDNDGIADYLDNTTACYVQQELGNETQSYFVESLTSTCLRQGEYALRANANGLYLENAFLQQQSLLPNDDETVNIGGLFDYVISGLSQQHTQSVIVIPQRQPIPNNPVYRKYNKLTGWTDFVENIDNQLWSAPGEPGYCPSPNINDGNDVWQIGLNPGYWCVQMMIKGGGLNDDDRLVNGTIVDPGFVGVLKTENQQPQANDDNANVVINEELTIDVLANDTDVDTDSLTITSAVANVGIVTIVDNKLHYMTPKNYDGAVHIIYGVSDNNGGSTQAVVNISIMTNTAPIVINEQSQINQGQSLTMNLLSNDSDNESDALSLVAVASSDVAFSINGQAIYTPQAEFFGVKTIAYTVEDTAGNQTEGQWVITVTQVHQVKVKTSGGGSINFFILALLLLTSLLSHSYKNCVKDQ